MPTLTHRDGVVAYTDEGAGEPLLLLHSSGATSAQWRRLRAEARLRYRPIAIDLYGYGGTSAWPSGAAMSFGDEVDLVAAVARIAAGPLHMVGHSYGGAIALKTALRLEARLASLTLIEPVMFNLLATDAHDDVFATVRALKEGFLADLEGGRLEAAAERFITYWMGPLSWSRMPPERRQTMLAAIPKIALEWIAAFAETTPLGAYRDIVAPTLLIRGADSTPAAHRITDLLSAALPNARLVEIPGAGHMSALTHADQVNAAILDHLEHNRQTGATP